MGKNKLFRFAENETFGHVVQPKFEAIAAGGFPLRGHWNRDFFRRARTHFFTRPGAGPPFAPDANGLPREGS